MASRLSKFKPLATGMLVMALVAGGAILYPQIAPAADTPDAKSAAPVDPLTLIKPLQSQIAQQASEEARSPLRLKLADAYMGHGRPIEAIAELQTWIKNNPTGAARENVLLTLIKAERESNDWNAAASISRSFVRDFPKSPSVGKVFSGLVEIARYGQNSPSSEASALSDWITATPGAPETAIRMLRLAKLQEQVGAVNEAVATLQRFAAAFPNAPEADIAARRAAMLMQDRLRATADAITAAQAYMAKKPNQATLSRDWQWIGNLCRSIEKHADAVVALKKSLAADPENREAAAQLWDSLQRLGDMKELAAHLAFLEQHYPAEGFPIECHINFGHMQIDRKQNLPGVYADAQKFIAAGARVQDAVGLMVHAAQAQGISQNDVIAALRPLYAKATGWNRSELALRLAELLRHNGDLPGCQTILENEIRDNPFNRRDHVRNYIEGAVENQGWEINAKQRTKYDLDAYVHKLVEAIKPNGFLPEVRAAMEDEIGTLSRLKLKESSEYLHQQMDAMAQTEIGAQVETVRREGSRDTNRAVDALVALLKSSKDHPKVFDALSLGNIWPLYERSGPENRARVLTWCAAASDANPGDVRLAVDVAGWFRNAGKSADAVRFYERAADLAHIRNDAWLNNNIVSGAIGGAIDVLGFELNKPQDAEKYINAFVQNAQMFPINSRQDRYRQLGDYYGRQKDGRPQQIAYYRKAADLGATGSGCEAAKNLMGVLPAADAVAYGNQLYNDPTADGWLPELGLMLAKRQAFDLKDLSAAVDTLARANEKRLTGFRTDWDNWNSIREIIALSLDVADPRRVNDPNRKALIATFKPLDSAKEDQLLSIGMQWLAGQQLMDVTREVIRRAGNSGNYGAQLDAFAQALSRTEANDQYYWDRSMEFINDELARGNNGTASTMLRVLLKRSSGYNEAARSGARNLLINAYRKFGEDLLAVDDKSPIAPLLKGASYLRLGEEKTAMELYQQNAAIFAQKIDEVPSEYVLFVGNELATGSDTDRDVAEQLLRLWLARADKQSGLDAATKAAVQLKLADVFYYARRFDVARAEYQSVIDKFPEGQQAIEAQFRIGESYMYQKNYIEAGKVFEKLRKNRDPETAIRGTFMSGVLQYTSGSREEARNTFKSLLDLSPSEELASKTLYQLALIYGDDNRFREMLDMLQAIGRLGREGKRWHTPGQNLTIMIHDPDMAVVQDAASVPVVVTTSGGDREIVTLTAGAAGKGFYLVDLPTALGAPKAGDGVLQVLGNDVITYDYTDEFKAKFKYVPPPLGTIRIASDATFAASTTMIVDEAKKSVVQRVSQDNRLERQADEAKEFRSSAEVKPGNPIYVRVVDPDRSVNIGINRVEVLAHAGSGDSIRAWINERSPNSGIFEGTIRTAERAPEALASDTALGKSVRSVTDEHPDGPWESQHDNQPGKWIAADLKDVYAIKTFTFAVPDAAVHAPKSWSLEMSNDGTHWDPVYAGEKNRLAYGLSCNYGPMRYSHYAWSKVKTQFNNAKPPEDLAGYLATVATAKAPPLDAEAVTTFEIPKINADPEADIHSYVGYFYVNSNGRVTFRVSAGKGGSVALVIDGRIISTQRDDFRDGLNVTLSNGWHRFAGFITVKPDASEKNPPRGFTFAQGSTNQFAPYLTSSNRDPAPVPALSSIPREPTVRTQGSSTTVDFNDTPVAARFMRLNIEQYSGDYVAISHLSVAASDGKILLPAPASAAAADENLLHVSPGDVISVSYSDQINTRTPGEARVLAGKLTATYYNAIVNAISYDVHSGPDGVTRERKQIARIDSGERFIAEITDYDEDTSPAVNTVPFRVRTESGAELKLEATETGPTTGAFTKEVDTGDGPGKLAVKPGERIYIIYTDRQNTNPGSRTDRVAEFTVAKPTEGIVSILPTRVEVRTNPATAGTPGAQPEVRQIFLAPEPGKPSRVVLGAPLTIEVIDPDAAKDAHSAVVVKVTTSAGAKLSIPLELSNGAQPGGRQLGTPLESGRFVGQALLVLGKPDENGKSTVNVPVESARNLLGAWRYAQDLTGDDGAVRVPVLAISGNDTITATYVDKRSPAGDDITRTAEARMVTDATLANLSRDGREEISTIHLGEKLFLRVEDADRDLTPDEDEITVKLTSTSGKKIDLKLRETLGHSGVFTAELPTIQSDKPDPNTQALEARFGDTFTLTYVDEFNTRSLTAIDRTFTVHVAPGADANVTAFSKRFSDQELAVETQFKLAECYFELFKSHNQLKDVAEAKEALEAGRGILASVRENYRGSNYEARVLYLLGGFHQELKEFDKAIECYQTVIRAYSNNAFAPDAQYKLSQCFEDKGDMDRACEEYVRLAYTYPDNPLIAKCMVRLSDYFYKSSKLLVAANICSQFLQQYPDHEWAPKLAFRQGQCYFKAAETPTKEPGASASDVKKNYLLAAKAFDNLVERYTDSDLRSDAMFWAGQSYHKAGDAQLAYRRYRRCTWDFPDSDAARYARGQLTLPEMLTAAKTDSGDEK